MLYLQLVAGLSNGLGKRLVIILPTSASHSSRVGCTFNLFHCGPERTPPRNGATVYPFQEILNG
jgi:hypothetical protein